MDFSGFDDSDWEFLSAAALVGLQAPDLEDRLEEVDALIEMRVPGQSWTQDNAETLREAFEIGWNVATENGTNGLAARHAHVAEAVGIDAAPSLRA